MTNLEERKKLIDQIKIIFNEHADFFSQFKKYSHFFPFLESTYSDLTLFPTSKDTQVLSSLKKKIHDHHESQKGKKIFCNCAQCESLYSKEIKNFFFLNSHKVFFLTLESFLKKNIQYKQLILKIFQKEITKDFLKTTPLFTKTFLRFFSRKSTIFFQKNLYDFFLKEEKFFLKQERHYTLSSFLKNYLQTFWQESDARKIKRKIIYHMGPTNSGKTFQAIQSLVLSSKACYLAPLRLLAYERYEEFLSFNLKARMITGEEVLGDVEAKHLSCTVEMCPLHLTFDEAVIDEIQLIGDSHRGFAWTRAFLYLQSPIIHLCGDDSVLELIKKLCTMIGDDLEIKTYNRLVPLKVTPSIQWKNLKSKDCLIAFSKRDVLTYQEQLKKEGKKAYVIYGMASPEIRREQAALFEKEVDSYLVATDAIAMGLNLSIKRIVFTTTTKMINKISVPLSFSEIKQIAGRAGRYLKYPEGEVTCLSKQDFNYLKKSLEKTLKQKELALLAPTYDLFLNLNKRLQESSFEPLKLSDFLRLFSNEYFPKPFLCADLSDQIYLADYLEKKKYHLNLEEQFIFTLTPINLDYKEIFYFFEQLIKSYSFKKEINPLHYLLQREDLTGLEINLKCLEVYFWLSERFSFFPKNELLRKEKKNIIASIQRILL